jgi:hypothetical protein
MKLKNNKGEIQRNPDEEVPSQHAVAAMAVSSENAKNDSSSSIPSPGGRQAGALQGFCNEVGLILLELTPSVQVHDDLFRLCV